MSQETINSVTQSAEAAAPSLSMQDLIQTVQIIAAVVQRGAIQAGEMSQVGGVYDRLLAFLEANGAVQKKTAEANQETNNA